MRKPFMALLLAAVLFTPNVPAFAWGDTGHMVVAQIAMTRLSRLNPTAVARVEELVKLVRANYTYKDKQGKFHRVNETYTPVTIANYMDDMRNDPKSEFLKPWHFTNVPFFDGIPEKHIDTPKINVESKIEDTVKTLRLDAFSTTKKKRLEEALNVAYLFHLVGDLHQPLHCVSRYSTEHPEGTGDVGGNLFYLDEVPPGEKHQEYLHRYWDAGGRQYDFISRPLGAAGFKEIRDYAFAAMKAYPETRTEWKVMDVSRWVMESHDLAVQNAYRDAHGNPLRQFVEPDDDYKARAQRIARERVAMAGYRLAELLNSIYANQH